MNQIPSLDSLARITPVTAIGNVDGGRALSLWWKLFLNASLMLMPVIIFWLAMPILGIGLLVAPGSSLLLALGSLVVALALEFAWAGTYPEWPMNRVLVHRLRQACQLRKVSRSPASGRSRRWIESARMVEWVPRDCWGATRLDTAEDVMFIRVDQHGIEMEGDLSFYHFPPASIIAVEVQSHRPTGCFHWLHFVVLTIRSQGGPIEIPLSYRDHTMGRLRSRHRWQQTQELAFAIRCIATGTDLTFSAPEDRVNILSAAHHGSPGPAGAKVNPYASPRSV